MKIIFSFILPVIMICSHTSYGQKVQQKNDRDSLKVQTQAAGYKYLDPKLPIEDRITDLLPRLTLEEKIIQLSDSWGSKAIPRLKIPAMLKTEGLHGQSYSTGATIFPHGIAMATTFNPDLIRQVGKATAVESKAANLRVSWSPVLDVARDARWGRVEETYGEDPYLVSRMGVAWIKGFQEENMIAIPKHFAGHGEPLGGRDSHDVGLSERTMRNYHLEPFRAAIKEAKAGGVMAAYGGWNGVPDNASGELLQKILREEWDFDGLVVSDCGGPEQFFSKHSIVGSLEEASARAVLAGVDIECGSANTKALANAIQKGFIRESDLDINLRRVFRAKFKLGLFENPGSGKMVWEKLPAYDVPEHRALTREVAVQGTVLLRNNNKLLPLNKSIKTIAVIGPNSDFGQTGDYSGKASPDQVITVLQGIKSHVSVNTKVLYAKGCDHTSQDSSGFAQAVETAAQADVVVLVVGDFSPPSGGNGKTTGENIDGATLEIPGVQRQLIKAIHATGKPVVLVLVNGKPFTLGWEDQNIPAIIETWYPGEEGGNALADLLFGDRNPSGRLPITFPRNAGQLPLRYNYETSGRRYSYYDMPFTPLYRFGFGLSYTNFKYSNLRMTPKKDDPGFITVSADISNTGERDGDEVAQLYVTDVQASVITPVIELKAVSKVFLAKGETKTVTFELTPYQLSLLDANMLRTVEPGNFRIHVGGVSPEPPAQTDFHKQTIGFKDDHQGISGEYIVPIKYAANFDFDATIPVSAKAGEPFKVTVNVKNTGNLLDIADIKLYSDELIDTRRFEIDKNESRTYTFSVTLYKSGTQTITIMLGKKLIRRSITLKTAPATLLLENARTIVGNDGLLHYTANATNTGSSLYAGSIQLQVEDKVAAVQTLRLEPGMRKEVSFDYAFPRSGTFSVKVGQSGLQQIVAPGGLTLELQDALVSLSFDNDNNNSVKNAVTNQLLPVSGSPIHINGKNGKAFKTDDKNTFITTGNIDIYRKPFTLAAWVNIEAADNGQAMFFGGQAPMGADVDITGTVLAAGLQSNNLLLSFQDRDIKGSVATPTGKWIHVAYTYNPKIEQGAVYVDGKLDKLVYQKPYAGPFDMIGGAPRFNHGKYAMDDVLITRSCLSPGAIQQLATLGVEALKSGELVTEWRTFFPDVNGLQSWADIPPGSNIKIIVETGDKDGRIIGSKTVELRSGTQLIPLTGLGGGEQIRMRVQLLSNKWGALPTLQTVILSGMDKKIRWSTTEEWQKGKATGGIKVGL